MEPWKVAFKAEYDALVLKIAALQDIIDQMDAGTLTIDIKSPRTLVFHQLHTMQVYAAIMEQRAVIEEITL